MRPEARDVRENNEFLVVGRLEGRKTVVLECFGSFAIPVGRRRGPNVGNGFGSGVGVGDLGDSIDDDLRGCCSE